MQDLHRVQYTEEDGIRTVWAVNVETGEKFPLSNRCAVGVQRPSSGSPTVSITSDGNVFTLNEKFANQAEADSRSKELVQAIHAADFHNNSAIRAR